MSALNQKKMEYPTKLVEIPVSAHIGQSGKNLSDCRANLRDGDHYQTTALPLRILKANRPFFSQISEFVAHF